MKEKQLQEVANLLTIGREVLSETKRLDYPAQQVLEKAWRKGLSSKPLIKGMLGLCILLLASCGTPRKLTPTAPPQSEPIGLDTPPPAPRDKEFVRVNSDNPAENGPSRQITPGPVAGAQSGFFGKLFGSKTASSPSKTHNLAGAQAGPRKCKGCTFNIVGGDQSNTSVGKKATAATAEGATATAIGKAKGPTAIGDSATAQDFTKQGQRGGAAASGAGATATATTVKGGWPWWLWVLIVGGGGFAIYRGYKSFFSV